MLILIFLAVFKFKKKVIMVNPFFSQNRPDSGKT